MNGKSLKLNAILNVIRQLSSILFPLITFPYISRVLQANSYGKISFGQSIISYFSLFAALGITNYAIREGSRIRGNKKEIERFSCEIFTINIITTTISYLLFFIILLLNRRLYEYKSLLIILSFSMFFAALGVEWIYTIYEDYLYITIRSLIVQIISVILMFVFIHSPEDYLFYAGITVFAAGGMNIFNYFHSRKFVDIKIIKKINIKKHIKPMLILFSFSLMTTIYVNSDITIIGLFKSDTQVGIYSSVVKIYSIIKAVLNAFLVVMVPRLSFYLGKDDREKYNELISKTLGYLMVGVFPIIAGLCVESENIIKIVCGDEYLEGAIALKILSFTIFFSLMAVTIVNLVLLPNKKDLEILKITSISAGLNIGLNLLIVPIYGINGAAFTTLIAEITVFALGILFLRKKNIVKIDLKKRDIASIWLACGCIFILCIFLNHILTMNVFVKEVITVLFSVLIYIVILYGLKNYYFINFLNEIKQFLLDKVNSKVNGK